MLNSSRGSDECSTLEDLFVGLVVDPANPKIGIYRQLGSRFADICRRIQEMQETIRGQGSSDGLVGRVSAMEGRLAAIADSASILPTILTKQDDIERRLMDIENSKLVSNGDAKAIQALVDLLTPVLSGSDAEDHRARLKTLLGLESYKKRESPEGVTFKWILERLVLPILLALVLWFLTGIFPALIKLIPPN